MTYEESAAMMIDMAFRGKVKVAALKFAGSILVEADSVPAHNTRERWAFNTLQNPDMVAGQLQSGVVMDPAIQTNGAAATDAEIQGATEALVNNLL